MALLTVSVVSNWTICHASDNKILAAVARNPFRSRPSFMINKERSGLGPRYRANSLSAKRNLPEARFHEGPILIGGESRPQTNS